MAEENNEWLKALERCVDPARKQLHEDAVLICTGEGITLDEYKAIMTELINVDYQNMMSRESESWSSMVEEVVQPSDTHILIGQHHTRFCYYDGCREPLHSIAELNECDGPFPDVEEEEKLG